MNIIHIICILIDEINVMIERNMFGTLLDGRDIQIAANIFGTLVNGCNIKVEKVILQFVLVGDRNIKMETVTARYIAN